MKLLTTINMIVLPNHRRWTNITKYVITDYNTAIILLKLLLR